ncbi:MAG: Asp-tRNA(Asn)/Glu-tRNA(Gln) amidotransferase subunit GatB [Chloroflexota bacterium]
MMATYFPTIGLEVHAELQTESKMFCGCRVVDSTVADPNIAVCPVCAGMPGMLPVVNQRAVEYGLRVALALGCEINYASIFARKNYFYPDLPKGYQISQYEEPIGRHGTLTITTSEGERVIRVRRVHLEEDTGKLTHVGSGKNAHSLMDLNRAGVPLLEIVSEPDLHTAEEVRAYAQALRSVLRYVGVNSGDLQKGVMRIEPNISIAPAGSDTLGTKVEIKNLNSFRALERGVAYEIQRQGEILDGGGQVRQETVGWDEARQATFVQRVKEGDVDYRYFPEPDLPPLVLDPTWIEQIRHTLPELPVERQHRFESSYGLTAYDASVLVAERFVADYFEAVIQEGIPAKMAANWISGDLFALLNQANQGIEECPITPDALAALLQMVVNAEINNNTAKTVLAEMFITHKPAETIVAEKGLRQVSDNSVIAALVKQVLDENPEPLANYLAGKETLAKWFFGQVMRAAQGKANPQVIQQELDRQLAALKP